MTYPTLSSVTKSNHTTPLPYNPNTPTYGNAYADPTSMVPSLEGYYLVQCPITPCVSWFLPGAPYKRHLWLKHSERNYLDPNATIIMNPSGLDELDEETSTDSVSLPACILYLTTPNTT